MLAYIRLCILESGLQVEATAHSAETDCPCSKTDVASELLCFEARGRLVENLANLPRACHSNAFYTSTIPSDRLSPILLSVLSSLSSSFSLCQPVGQDGADCRSAPFIWGYVHWLCYLGIVRCPRSFMDAETH